MKDIQPGILLLLIIIGSIGITISIVHYSHAEVISTNDTQVHSTDSKPYGLTYGEWTAKWWKWAYSIPKNVNPSYDDSGRFCSEGQNGPVWFLTGSYKHHVDRYCNIPAGKSILFPILNSECSIAEFPYLKSEQDLCKCAKEMQDSVIREHVFVDGVSIKDLDKSRVQSPLFCFTLGTNNILGLPSQTTQAISDGNWVFLKLLPVGKHTIYFKGDLKSINAPATGGSNGNHVFAGPYGWDAPITYHLTIT
jgi:hypothetical protein